MEEEGAFLGEACGSGADELSQADKNLLVGIERASGDRSETPWRRQDHGRAVEGHERTACLKDCGASVQWGQALLGSGLSHEW